MLIVEGATGADAGRLGATTMLHAAITFVTLFIYRRHAASNRRGQYNSGCSSRDDER